MFKLLRKADCEYVRFVSDGNCEEEDVELII